MIGFIEVKTDNGMGERKIALSVCNLAVFELENGRCRITGLPNEEWLTPIETYQDVIDKIDEAYS